MEGERNGREKREASTVDVGLASGGGPGQENAFYTAAF